MKWLVATIATLIGSGIVIYFVPEPFRYVLLFSSIPVSFYCILNLFNDDPDLDDQKVFSAELISVHDGDSVKLNFHGREESYRILFIDAPEIGQDYDQESAATLVALLNQGFIEFSVPTNSSYGRNVCSIYVNGTDVGLVMLRRGCAWIDTRYTVPPSYIRAFADAVEGKKGIFAKNNPVHPSMYRAKKN